MCLVPLLSAFSRPSSPTKPRDIDSDVATVSTARPVDSDAATVSTSRQRSVERRPMGPRARSPLPRTPEMRAHTNPGEPERVISPVRMDRARTPIEMERAVSPDMMGRTRSIVERARSPIEVERARIERAINAGPRPISPGPGPGRALSPPPGSRPVIPAPVARKPVPSLPVTERRVASPPLTRAFSPSSSVMRSSSPTPVVRPLSPRPRAVSPAPVVRKLSIDTTGYTSPSRAMSPVGDRVPTPLAWGKGKTRRSDEPERPRTPPARSMRSDPAVPALRTEAAGGTPMPVAARRRMPFESAVNNPPPAAANVNTPKSPQGTVAPLSIQKKTSLRENPVVTTRKGRGSPTAKTPARTGSLVRLESTSESESSGNAKPAHSAVKSGDFTGAPKRLFIAADATKEDVSFWCFGAELCINIFLDHVL